MFIFPFQCLLRLAFDQRTVKWTNEGGEKKKTMSRRCFSCTTMNECATKLWQKTADQCSQIVSAQPVNASVDQSQWVCFSFSSSFLSFNAFCCRLKINLAFSKLPSLEHNEIYQCIFTDGQSSLSSEAIKLDHNRLSCPTPSSSSSLFLSELSQTIVRLSVIKWPSNTTIATIPEFTFYNCSTSSSCLTCRSQIGCQWCSQRCRRTINVRRSSC